MKSQGRYPWRFHDYWLKTEYMKNKCRKSQETNRIPFVTMSLAWGLRSRICFSTLAAVRLALHVINVRGQQRPPASSPRAVARSADYVEGETSMRNENLE